MNVILRILDISRFDGNHPSDWGKACKVACLKVMHNDLWVGVGPFLVISTFQHISIQPHHCIRLHTGSEKLCVSGICIHKDQVWVSCQQRGFLLELDAGSYDVICCLLCTQNSCSIVDLSNSDLKISSHKITNDMKNSSEGESEMNKSEETESGVESVVMRMVSSMKEKVPNNFLQLSKDFRTLSLNTKLSRSRRKISMRRKKLSLKNEEGLQRVGAVETIPVEKESVICKVLCCNDLLWTCFSNGKILLINSNQDNSCGMNCGSLVAMIDHYNITDIPEKKKTTNQANIKDITVTPEAIKEIELTDLLLMADPSKSHYASEGGLVVSLISCKLRKVDHRRSQAFSWQALGLSDLLAQKKDLLCESQ